MAAYYPRKMATFKDLQKTFDDAEFYDEKEEYRLEQIKILKARGKGAPKKKRTAEESKKFKGKKRA